MKLLTVTQLNSRIQLPCGQIFWRELGHPDHPSLVFLHGTWDDSTAWIPLMTHLGEDYHCLAPDLLGFGESFAPEIDYSIELEVDCLSQFIEQLKLAPFHIVAEGLGAWVAVNYVHKYPKLVSSLTLIAPIGISNNYLAGYSKFQQWLINRPLWLKRWQRSLNLFLSLFPNFKPLQASVNFWQRFIDFPATYHLLFKRSPSSIIAELVTPDLPDIYLHTLILQGSADWEDVIDQANSYVDNLPEVSYQLIDGGNGHLPQQMPELLADRIRNYHQKFNT